MKTKLNDLYEKDIKNCKYKSSCLQSCQGEPYPVNLKSQKNLWIGQKYGQGKIMLVGINRNLGGGYSHLDNEIDSWVRQNIQELAKYRTGKRANHSLKHIKPNIERFLNKCMKDDEEAFQHICFTETIKCSPSWKGSVPTEKMIENCSREMKYIKQEISILHPRLVIAFGEPTARIIKDLYEHDNVQQEQGVYIITDKDHKFVVVGFFHPSNLASPRLINKYLPTILKALYSDPDLTGKIPDEVIGIVKTKSREPDYFRNLYELNLIDTAKHYI